MAQIIKHRRGSLESLSAVTGSLQKGEIVIASGSSNLTTTNGSSIVFAVPSDGQVQAVNRFLIGSSAPATFAASTYNGMVNGVPFYDSGSGTLYLLGSGGNTAINLVGNIQPFSSSVATSINALSASIGSGTIGTSVTLLNDFTGSQLTQNSTLATYTASVDTRFTEIGVVSGSLISSASAAAIANANQNTFTASVSTRLTEVGVVTGSLINSASNAASRLTNIEGFSSSFDTAFNISGSDVTIAGNLTVQGTQTIVDSTTIQLGDNIIELNGTGATNGGLWVKDPTAPNTATGSIIWDTTNDYWKAGVKGSEIKVLLAGGDSVVSGSSQITLQSTTGFTAFDSALATITGSLISSASAAKSTNDSQGVRLDNLESTSASVNVSVAALNAYTSSNTSTTALNAFTASANTRFTEIGVVSGSLIASASTAKSTNDSQDVSISALNSFSSSQLTKDSTLATYTGSVETRLTEVGVVSGSLIASASAAKSKNDSQDVSISNLNSTTASLNTSVSNINTFTSSADSRLDTLEGTGTIQGVGTSNNVTFAKVTTTGDVVVGGDLVVQGNTVTLNTAQLVVEDKVITLASGSTSSATADGAGFEIAGASANFVYQHSSTTFTSSIAITAPAVTASINLGSGAGSSKRVAFRNTNGNLDLVPTASVAGDLLQWDGSDFVMSNVIDGGSF